MKTRIDAWNNDNVIDGTGLDYIVPEKLEIFVKEMPIRVSQIHQLDEGYCNNYIKLEYDNRNKVKVKLLKDHDKELVAKVFYKIKEQLGFIINGQERIICDGSMTGDKTILAILDQIQKEFEDE